MASRRVGLLTVFHAARNALHKQGAPFCITGGLARAFLAEPRTTKDVDFAVDADDPTLVVRKLESSGFVVRHVFESRDGTIGLAQLTLLGSPVRCDLLFARSDFEREAVGAARLHDLPSGARVPVMNRPHLIATSLVARQPFGLGDVCALVDAATPAEVRAVHRVLAHLPPGKRRTARTDGVISSLNGERGSLTCSPRPSDSARCRRCPDVGSEALDRHSIRRLSQYSLLPTRRSRSGRVAL